MIKLVQRVIYSRAVWPYIVTCGLHPLSLLCVLAISPMPVTLLSAVPDGDRSFSHPSLLKKLLDWSPVRMLATSLCVLWLGDHSFVMSALFRFCSYSHPKPFSPTPLYTLFSSLIYFFEATGPWGLGLKCQNQRQALVAESL